MEVKSSAGHRRQPGPLESAAPDGLARGPGPPWLDPRPVILAGAAAALHVANLDQLRRVVAQLPLIRMGEAKRGGQRGAELAGLITGILDLYRPALEAYVGEVENLSPADDGPVRMVLELPREAAAAAEQLLGLLESADELVHGQGLGAVAASDEVRQLRRWMTTEIVAQLTSGRVPHPFRARSVAPARPPSPDPPAFPRRPGRRTRR